MKALVYTGVETLEYLDVATPEPSLGRGEAGGTRVKIMASGICGSDMHAYLGHDDRRPAPLILGHEAAGVTDDGRRVTINPLVACGACEACKQGRENLCPDRRIISMPPAEGAFAEYVTIRDENLIDIPDGISFDKAALAEPLACGWHAVRLALQVNKGNALVIGGGAIGVGAYLALKAFGVDDVTISEPNKLRAEYLRDHGFTVGPAQDAHIVIDAVGFEATRAEASARVRPGGVIAHIGLGSDAGGLDIRRMTLHEITFIGTYTYTPQDFRDTAAAIFDGRLGPLDWTENRNLKHGHQAFKDIRAGATPAPKIILQPEH